MSKQAVTAAVRVHTTLMPVNNSSGSRPQSESLNKDPADPPPSIAPGSIKRTIARHKFFLRGQRNSYFKFWRCDL